MVKRRLVRWYMGRVAGRYCPCEWPVQFSWLVYRCARIDDAAARYDAEDYCGFWLVYDQTTSSSTSAVTFTVTAPGEHRGRG